MVVSDTAWKKVYTRNLTWSLTSFLASLQRKILRTKAQRKSGKEITKLYDPVSMPYEEIKWNDWNDWRDSWRDRGKDKKLMYRGIKNHNKKLLIKEKVRRIRKYAKME